MNKSKVLVTGGSGYIGSHTVVELQNAGCDVIVIDNLSNSYSFVNDSIEKITNKKPEFYNIDLCDANALDIFFEENKDISTVIHFAAYKSVGESVKNPLKYYRNNISGLINLLECMQKYGVENIVFSSSCTVYGQPEILPVSESSPIVESFSPYGNTKILCEKILQDVVKTKTLNVISLRYFNPIGAHESALIGELPLGTPENLLPYITQTGIGKRNQLSVYGNDYNTKDGTCIRDYIHVVDLAKAHISALERLEYNKTKQSFEAFNIGTGKGFSVLEIIEMYEKVSGLKLSYVITDRRAGDIEAIWADSSYANNELGWHAKRDLESMVLSSWKWEIELSKKENKL
ncbi:MAG: UDP-glucose 4-epimerase GalE [Bacteroidetes bacterium GWE2_29_8]|nr:MAG: UDP-glucose 4-epimerase GalE [Bacteroidetes bacterium GWE2_29_8]OFY21932.1 MAG: UDP-glucose 4-epimerase GalE [Bacteroidetes bacterium GWF2_29_10]